MYLLSPLIFGISASLDALLVGITFGIRGTKIPLRHNLLISLITLIGTCLSVGLGSQLTTLVNASFWQMLSGLILLIMGIYYIIKFMIALFKIYQPEQEMTATESPSVITSLQACSLGCALSANNMGIGLSASLGGLSPISAGIVTLLFSFIFLLVGNYFGRSHTLQMTEHTANGITGFLLISLGILQWCK